MAEWAGKYGTKKCPACLQVFSPTCQVCLERTQKREPSQQLVRSSLVPADLSPIQIFGIFPWPVHEPVWVDSSHSSMFCKKCGIRIPPTMTMAELTGACSGSARMKA